MAIVFKYKNATSLSYAPGFANAGIDGEEGKQGISGNTVYFIDYDLDNSYSIQLALQRIENNQLLSSTSRESIEDRPYKENDLLMSKNGNIYKIVLANQTSAQNYKFDIVSLGTIRDAKPALSVSKAIIYNITGWDQSRLYSGDTDSQLLYEPTTISPAFTNRTKKNIFQEITEEDKILYGVWFKIFLVVEAGNITEEASSAYFALLENLLSNYSFSLSILLNCKKSLQDKSAPTDMGNGINSRLDPSPSELYQCFDTYKKLEFINLPVIFKGNNDTFENLANREISIISKNNIRNPQEERLINTFFLSDFSMDKMHPTGNNIRCTLGDKENIWFKTGNNAPDTYNIDIDSLGDAYVFPFTDNEVTPTETDTKFSKCEMTDIQYYYNMIGSKRDDSTLTDISPDIFPSYAIGRSLTLHNNDDAQDILDNLDTTQTDLIQMSQRYLGNSTTPTKNLRSGDSAYFSSLPENMVAQEITKYLENFDENKYILTIKNKKTKEISTVEIPVEFTKV